MTFESLFLSYLDDQPAGRQAIWSTPGFAIARQHTEEQLLTAQATLENFRQELMDRLDASRQHPRRMLEIHTLLAITVRVLDQLKGEINLFIGPGHDQS